MALLFAEFLSFQPSVKRNRGQRHARDGEGAPHLPAPREEDGLSGLHKGDPNNGEDFFIRASSFYCTYTISCTWRRSSKYPYNRRRCRPRSEDGESLPNISSRKNSFHDEPTQFYSLTVYPSETFGSSSCAFLTSSSG